ncbi:hypothetical protein FRC04_010509 [Tulasnella sp. 424]|nr:hypothetical protein FRC04_010509 [Tulasnella sp. 424]KAG8976865.1 hypothetical protein FRC05_002802 [Tulasnella sp. 425]
MARSDYSSDPDDGSITSSGSAHEDEMAIGPTSAVAQQKLAPWQAPFTGQSSSTAAAAGTAPNLGVSTGNKNHGGDEIQPRSPASPSRVPQLAELLSSKITGPNARFRSVVTKVIRLNRLRGLSDDEPGVNVASDAAAAIYGHIRERCSIDVMDYGPTKFRHTKLTNEELESHIAHESRTRPLWAKVRWINIGGISWDVVKALAVRYEIHPLVIEDMLHGRQTYSSKADYYNKHLFVRMLCHTLKEEDDDSPNVKAHNTPRSDRNGRSPTPPPTYTSRQNTVVEPQNQAAIDHKFESADDLKGEQGPRPGLFNRRQASMPSGPGSRVRTLAGTSFAGAQPWMSSDPISDPEKVWARSVYPNLGGNGKRSNARKYSMQLASMFETNPSRSSETQAKVNELKKGERVEVKLRNLYCIMFRDGTLITIHQDVSSPFFHPIMSRLRQRDTLLRNTADVSLLLQGIIDLLVDHAVKVVDKYHEQILKFEKDILIRPKMKTVKFLHIASGDLTMHKRTLSPLKSLIYGLRRYDLDRAVAQANSSDPGFDEKKITGFMSHKSKIYLADVMDHMEYILASLEMFESITENLIAYTFNIVSYDMNTTMRTLTIATVIFFPLTFLTGYFGMNFNGMLSVQAHSEAFFWTLALPVMGVTVLAFNVFNILNFFHWVKKKLLQRQIGSLAR